mmetsp:Transcript_21830/g.47533  ORF Transcript_21830/g.47533 Transcript_21830/m.47533 type:complete len:228 (+) Transcript_21830:245-928(+)
MLRPATVCINASARRVVAVPPLKLSCPSQPVQKYHNFETMPSTISRIGSRRSRFTSSFHQRPSYYEYGTQFGPLFNNTHRHHSAGNGVNGESPSSDQPRGMDIIESSAATSRWKRDHYRKIEDKFPSEGEDGNATASEEENGVNATTATATATASAKQQSEPLNIDNYEDVQPMWKEMESRVTRRRSLTLEERGGLSGRRNVRKSEEDMWLEAGVYEDSDDESLKKE